MESAASPRRALRRDPDRRMIAGVCAGIAGYFGVDPLLVRIGFVIAAAAGGFGILAYVACMVLMPAEAGSGTIRPRRAGRAAIEVGVGAGLLLLSLLLTLRALGFWFFSDAVVWPLVLVAAGGALIWRQSAAAVGESSETAEVSREEPAAGGGAKEPRRTLISRTGLGVALVIAAGIVFLQATGSLSAARNVLLAVLVVAVGLGVIFAPWIARLVRSLSAERSERIRSQERAEMAAHLHDSVLQTLALMQKRADDPREVAALARRQERELRSWLSGRESGASGLGAALEAAADEIEQAHGVPIEVVTVGEVPLDQSVEALVAATREAMLNAVKFGGGSPVDVYAEATPERLEVFVRDRGPGFDPAAVSPDRRGVRESIIGRMERHGGHAAVRAAEGGGTEVELRLER
ncbi:MAG TPA: PspC domain-containing protein [Thermoleophilaceae bacterium]|nr:PspC domain-containing protein [Thermoleophilaceae bacterium]